MRRTSLDAYQMLRDSGRLSRLQWTTYDALFINGPLTRNELDALLGGEHAINASYSRRLTELERMGVVERVGTRRCRYTKRECDAWDVTDAPRAEPIPKTMPQKRRADLYRQKLREIAGWLNGGDVVDRSEALKILTFIDRTEQGEEEPCPQPQPSQPPASTR